MNMTDEDIGKALNHAADIISLFSSAAEAGDLAAQQICKSTGFAVLKMAQCLPEGSAGRVQVEKVYDELLRRKDIGFIVF